jgi:hypothetical protein
MFQQHGILKLLVQMSSRALKLLQQATRTERSKVALLSGFVEVQLLLPAWQFSWRLCCDASNAAGIDTAVAAQQQLALQQLQQAGKCILRALTITMLISHSLSNLLAVRCIIACLSADSSRLRMIWPTDAASFAICN